MRSLLFRLRTRTRLRARGAEGWTLIEMLVVLSLIMILASLALTQYRNSIQTAKEATLRANLYHMREAIDQYYADKGRYPDSLDTLVSERYLRAIPKDPITDTTDWQTIQAESEPGSSTLSPGIYEVKSASSAVAMDGSPYATW
jgi:general secretion pathway protein G